MSAMKFLLVSVILTAGLQEILGHAMVMDPVNRSSAWRQNFKTPINNNDNVLYCGGIINQFEHNGGRCGLCGDNYANPQPRANENGGIYGTGTIVKTYKSGQLFTATVEVDVNHEGYFEFSMCPLSHPKELETEECFDAYPVMLANGSRRYQLYLGAETANNGTVEIDLVLPAGLRCEHCVFRWDWKVVNDMNACDDGYENSGCKVAGNWRTCSDITIL